MAVRIPSPGLPPTEKITPGHTIAEATSGNTGISFAAIGRMLGHPVQDFYAGTGLSPGKTRPPDPAVTALEVVSVSKDEGGFLGSIRRCGGELAASCNGNLPSPGNFSKSRKHGRAFGNHRPRKSGRNSFPSASAPQGFVAGRSVPAARSWESGKFLRQRDPSIPRATLWEACGIPPAPPRVAKVGPSPHSGNLRRVHSGNRPPQGNSNEVSFRSRWRCPS